MKRLALIGFACVLVQGCALSSAPQGKSSQARKAERDLQAARAREAHGLQTFEIASKSHSFIAQIEASAPPTVERKDGFYHLAVPLEGAALACFVYEMPVDLAHGLVRLTHASLREAQHSTTEIIESGEIAGLPYLAAETSYRHESAEQGIIGEMKYFIAAKDHTAFACVLDGAGFTQTFRRIFTGFAESLRLRGRRQQEPMYREVHSYKQGSHTVGLWETFVYQQDGGYLEIVYDSQIKKESVRGLAAQDKSRVNHVDGDGMLLQAEESFMENEQLLWSLELSRISERVYGIGGEVYGIRVGEGFNVPRPLMGILKRSAALQEAARSTNDSSHSLWEYEPALNYELPTQVTARAMREANGERSHISMVLGGQPATCKLDAHGLFEQCLVQQRTGKLRLERVFQAGQMPKITP